MTGLLFVSTAAVIVLAGTNLSRYGDVIAARSGLGRTRVGLVLTASVTSLPELVTGLSSTLVHDAPDVAVGDVAGSCVFNLLLFVLVYRLAPPGTAPPSLRGGPSALLAFGAAGLGVVALALAFPAALPRVGWVGAPSLALFAIYALALRGAFAGKAETPAAESGLPLRKAVGLYAVNAALVVAAAGVLPRLAVDVAERSGLGQSFVGSVFVGTITSLPEIAVTVAAVRMGAADLAVGNLLGSNLFDLLVLGLDDVAYARGPLLDRVGPGHLVPVLAALLMSGVLAWAPRRVVPLALMLIYAAHLVLAYVAGRA